MKQGNHYRLNDSEVVLGSSDNESVVFDRGGFLLTNHRVIQVTRTPFGGETMLHTFCLENLDSVQVSSSSPYQILLVGVGCFAAALMWGKGGGVVALGFLVLLVACVTYYFSRKKVIRLTSFNGKIELEVAAMAHSQIQELVFAVEQAKRKLLDAKS